MNHLDFILKLEGGDLESRDEFIEGMQRMINDGTVWELQGMYGRAAVDLLRSGECHPPYNS